MVEANIERGIPPPDWLQKEPDLLPGDEFYLEAFWELNTCRTAGTANGPIPWRDIVNYADYVELEPDLIPKFVYIIRSMDNAYLKYMDNKSSGTSTDFKRRRPKGLKGRHKRNK